MASSEDPDNQTNRIICEDCTSDKGVTSYCVDCKVNLCEGCKSTFLHKKHKVLSTTYTDELSARQKQPKLPCKRHSDRECISYCIKCNKPCCRECLTDEHYQHSNINLEVAIKDATENVHSCIENLEANVLPSIEQFHSAVLDGIARYTESLDKATEASKRRFQSLREEIDRAEKDWMQQLETIKEADFTEMERIRNEVEDKINQTKDLISTCKTVMSESNELDLLSFKSKRPNICEIENGPVSLPASVHFQPSNFKTPKVFQLIGRIGRGRRNCIESIESEPAFSPSMIDVRSVKTIDGVRSDALMHTKNNDVWVNNNDTTKLTLYNESIKQIRAVSIDFSINDMAQTSLADIIVTDGTKKRLLRISASGVVRSQPVRATAPLEPWGICINDKQQIVTGLRAAARKQPIKLIVCSLDGSTVHQEIEKDESGKPFFKRTIYQVKQKKNGDYVVSDGDRIVCVSREGKRKWNYKVERSESVTYAVFGIVCDKYDNVIIAEYFNKTVYLLDNEGKLVTILLNKKDGIIEPYSLSVDKQGFLWVGQKQNTKVVKYIK